MSTSSSGQVTSSHELAHAMDTGYTAIAPVDSNFQVGQTVEAKSSALQTLCDAAHPHVCIDAAEKPSRVGDTARSKQLSNIGTSGLFLSPSLRHDP